MRGPLSSLTLLVLLGGAMLTGCVANSDGRAARTPWGKLERVLALDFSPRAAQHRVRSFRRVFDLPVAEASRATRIVAHARTGPAKVTKRASTLPGTINAGVRAELARSLALARPQAALRQAIPDPDRFAATLARDLARVGRLLGLERRPMGEITDREHRTDPHDDRPEASFWARLQRRIFP